MLTDDEIKAIEAEGYLDGPVPALLADRQELMALARELARQLDYTATHEAACGGLQNRGKGRCLCGYSHTGKTKALAKARAAGVLSEGE